MDQLEISSPCLRFSQSTARARSGSAGVETTYFIGELLEKVVTAGTTDYRHLIKVGGSTVAIYSRTGSGAVTVRYVLQDHQGSVAGILNSDGTTYVKESFTAFGERRNQCTWSGPPTIAVGTKSVSVLGNTPAYVEWTGHRNYRS